MTRDMTLLIKILRCIRRKGDAAESPQVEAPDFAQAYSEKRVRYHLDLCEQAGFLHRHEVSRLGQQPTWSLTWAGHEYLDSRADC